MTKQEKTKKDKNYYKNIVKYYKIYNKAIVIFYCKNSYYLKS